MFAKRLKKPHSNLLIEDIQHVLVRAADKHAGVATYEIHNALRGLRGADVKHRRRTTPRLVGVGDVGCGARVISSSTRGLCRRAYEFDLVDEDIDALVKTSRN